jgi:hypothetical protein
MLPVRIWGVDASCRPFMQLATVCNISDSGALLEGMRCQLRPGEVVDVQYNGMRAEFMVVWAGKQGSCEHGELGLQTLPSQPSLWDSYLERAYEFMGNG